MGDAPDLLGRLWDLRTDPFSPTAVPPLDEDLLFKSLDPNKDTRACDYYFDFYDWERSRLLRGLSRSSLFEKFPRETDLSNDGSLLLLIAGSNNTGRQSLANLILHKIRVDTTHNPLVVKSVIGTRDHSTNIKAVARAFLDQYESERIEQPALAKIKEIFADEISDRNTGTTGFYVNLFQRWRQWFENNNFVRPFVLMLAGADTNLEHYDSWRAIYSSAQHLFRVILVQTSQVRPARDCYDLMMVEQKNAALILAPKLTRQVAENYLKTRLSAERRGGNDPSVLSGLEPFAEEALAELYAPGSKPKEEPLGFTILQLNQTFKRALDNHISDLSEAIRKEGEEIVTKQPKIQLLIGRGEIQRARSLLNLGQ